LQLWLWQKTPAMAQLLTLAPWVMQHLKGTILLVVVPPKDLSHSPCHFLLWPFTNVNMAYVGSAH